MKKLLVVDYPSYFESKVINNVTSTAVLSDSDIVVNPEMDNGDSKVVVINLPSQLFTFHQNGRVVSRFPMGNSRLAPYKLPDRIKVKKDEIVPLILTESLLKDPKYIKLVHNSNFILGVDELVNGYPTLIGQLVLKTDISDLIQNGRSQEV